ncbi:helix-turn-helix domain-containing protein [Kibdelosporangium aridum]|uniref:helix-turn-helix domain-containing protein n=1 Tax=Kibdelosporangium aridum TaxID=2030 RepID=UPI001F39124E|nr:helix-turn-helix domain-containing protein [Kibdelosporangium aridum]
MRKIGNRCDSDDATVEGRTASPDYDRRRLSDTDIAEVIEAYRSGATTRALAESYGVSQTTIKKKLRERKIRKRGADTNSPRRLQR